MNRHERRRAKREGEKEVIKPVMIHEGRLREKMLDIQDELVREARLETIKLMQMAFVVALNNEFEFGAKRIKKAIARTIHQFECLSKGLISYTDMVTMCKEIGIKI